MRIFSQALKPLITAFLKPMESATAVGRPGQSASSATQHPARLGTTPGEIEKLTRLKSRLIMESHHEEATRLLVTKMMSNRLPVVPTHVPNLAHMKQLREQKKLAAMFPAVPTHIPQFKAGQKRGSASQPLVPKFIYQSVSQGRGARSASRYPASINGRSQDRLSIVKNHINATNAKIAKLDLLLARTSDPASRLRILAGRRKEHAKLMKLRSLGVKLRYLSNKAIR
jgi:hypothetical protein